MKSVLIKAAAAVFLSVPLQAQDFAPLDSLMKEYTVALAPLDDAGKFSECDFLVSSCKDSLTRQHVAMELFNHYKDSRIMGEEAVAIHLWDRWFADGSVAFKGEFDRMDAEMFVKFNRSSLLGMDAPELTLSNPIGRKFTIPEKNGRTSVLFFYDPECAKCKLAAMALPSVLKDVDFKMNLYTVLYGSDRKAWRKWRHSLKTGNRNIRVVHLWDPEIKSDYQKKYGVLTTPKLYMVEPGGSIIGRRLELENLEEMIPYARSIQSVLSATVGNTDIVEQGRK